jgi:HlyD family secretion protein
MNMMSDMVSEQPALSDNPRRDIRIGAAIAFFFFVVLLGWAAFAPLDAGVRGSGKIAVSGNRQAVQHREGGVVNAIYAREGQHVREGQILVEMAAPDLKANERALTSDYLNLLAQRARLMAERAGQTSFAPPPEFASVEPGDRPLAEQAMKLQLGQLRARVNALSAQQSVLGQRSRQLGEQRSGFEQQRSSYAIQYKIMQDELDGLKSLEKRGFASTNRIRELERAQEELRGRQAAMSSEMARAGEGMGETRMQSLSIRQSNLEEVATDLRDTQSRLSEVLPKLVAAREQLRHSTVRAPATGQVVGLTIFTEGGVVAPGQTLMEIVPDNKALVVQVQLSPQDADDVYRGQKAQLRFVSVHNSRLPLLSGKVRTMSADSFTDENSGRSYFRAEVEVPRAELDELRDVLGRGQLRPGLPVEVVLETRSRTALQYLLEPLTDHFWSALREQ